MQYRWGGPMALTWNSVPIFGEIEPGAVAACARELGASKSTAAGIAAAEAVVGLKSPLVEVFSNYDSPKILRSIPEHRRESDLRLREWRAGRE